MQCPVLLPHTHLGVPCFPSLHPPCRLMTTVLAVVAQCDFECVRAVLLIPSPPRPPVLWTTLAHMPPCMPVCTCVQGTHGVPELGLQPAVCQRALEHCAHRSAQCTAAQQHRSQHGEHPSHRVAHGLDLLLPGRCVLPRSHRAPVLLWPPTLRVPPRCMVQSTRRTSAHCW